MPVTLAKPDRTPCCTSQVDGASLDFVRPHLTGPSALTLVVMAI